MIARIGQAIWDWLDELFFGEEEKRETEWLIGFALVALVVFVGIGIIRIAVSSTYPQVILDFR